MPQQFTILSPGQKRHITACVGFVRLKSQHGMFVVVKNKRGWDIPGGHVEDGEEPLETFARELLEESGCILLPGASLIAILESKKDPRTGIAVYYGSCTEGVFNTTHEIKSRKFVSAEQLLKEYFGDKELLQGL